MPILDSLQATMQIRSNQRARMAHDQASTEHPGEHRPPCTYKDLKRLLDKRASAQYFEYLL